MRKFTSSFLLLFLLALPIVTSLKLNAQIKVGSVTVDAVSLVKNRNIPWDLSWGPDNFLWFTERDGKVSRMNSETGQVFEILSSLPDLWTQNPPLKKESTGLFAMVIHPDFSTTPHVFLYYTARVDGNNRVKIVRYTYNKLTDKLESPFVLTDKIPATTNFHNSGRMVITPDKKLLIATGDISNNSTPQNRNSLNGKILRLNLDGTVPSDNPTPGSYVYSIGHRHAQGFVYSPDRTILYSSEHGAGTDDELNIIEPNRNYGWPNVEGLCNTTAERDFCNANNVRAPLIAWTPTIAPCGIEFYNSDMIPEWKNSILLATLKERDLRVLKLSADGKSITRETLYYDYDKGFGRLRDVVVSPDGDIYVCTTNRDDNGRNANPPPGIPAADDDQIIRIANIAPRALKIRQNSNCAVELEWKDRWSKETGVRVYRSLEPTANFSVIATLGANTTTYIDRTVSANQQYYYSVQTFNNSTTSDNSNTINVTAVGTNCGGGGGNQAPIVSISAPQNNASFKAPATILIKANASDADGAISKVSFYNGNTMLGEDNTAPYEYNWNNVGKGNYTIKVKATDDKGLTAEAMVTVVVIEDGGGNTTIVSGNVYKIISAVDDASVLDVAGGATANKTAIIVWPSHGGNNQKWKVVATGNGYYEIISLVNFSSVLDVQGIKSANGTQVQLYAPNRGTNQRWKITSVGGGYFSLSPQNAPGSSMDLTGCSVAGGTRLQIFESQNNNCQKWRFVDLGPSPVRIQSPNQIVSVFPTPTNNSVMVKFISSSATSANCQIIDVSGKVFINQTAKVVTGDNQIQFNTDKLANGVYFITIELKGEMLRDKLVVLK